MSEDPTHVGQSLEVWSYRKVTYAMASIVAIGLVGGAGFITGNLHLVGRDSPTPWVGVILVCVSIGLIPGVVQSVRKPRMVLHEDGRLFVSRVFGWEHSSVSDVHTAEVVNYPPYGDVVRLTFRSGKTVMIAGSSRQGVTLSDICERLSGRTDSV